MGSSQPFQIIEPLLRGENPDIKQNVNANFLVACEGLRPTPWQLGVPFPITPLDDTSGTHPFPTIHVGRRRSYIFQDTHIFTYNRDTRATGTAGVEITTNGTFTGAATGWTATGWTYASNHVSHNTGNTTALSQTTSLNVEVTAGRRYRTSYVVSNRTAGSVHINVGSTGAGTTRSTNATFTEDIVAAGTSIISFTPTTDFDGTIDTVSVRLLEEIVYDIVKASNPTVETLAHGLFDDATPWSLGSGLAIDTGAGTLTATAATATASETSGNQSSALVKGQLYRAVVTISSISGGSVQVLMGSGGAGTSRTAAGTYEEDIICQGSTTFALNFTGATAVVTLVSVKKIDELALTAGGGPWQVADFGDTLFAAKDAVTIVRLPYYSNFRWVGFTYAVHDLKSPVLVNLGNTLLMSGLDSTTLFDPTGVSAEPLRWQDLWAAWIQASPPGVVTHTALAMNPSTVFYFTDSGGDYNVPFIMEMAMLGYPNRLAAKNTLIDSYTDVLLKGENGFLPLPWQKTALAAKALGDGAALYCADGISFLRRNQSGRGMDAIDIKAVGLAQKGAVAGNYQGHCLVDKNGMGWHLGPDLQLTKLNYRYNFLDLLDNSATISSSFDEEEMEYYFSNGTVCFVIRANSGDDGGRYFSFCKLRKYIPTNFARIDEDLVGAGIDTGDSTFLVETMGMDFGLDEQKILDQVGVTLLDATNATISIKLRNDRILGDDGYITIPAVPLNRANTIYPNHAARDFRFVLEGTIGDNTKLERIAGMVRRLEKRNHAPVVGVLSPGFRG